MPGEYSITRLSTKLGDSERLIVWRVYRQNKFVKSFDLKRDAIDWVMRQEAKYGEKHE